MELLNCLSTNEYTINLKEDKLLSISRFIALS